MEGTYRRIFELARPLLETRDNVLHTRIAYSFALRLLEAEGGDPAVALPAIILHDTGWKSIPEELQVKAFGPGKRDMTLNRVHEVEGAKRAREILEEIEYPSELVDRITEIILGHDSREEVLSLEDSIVKDSDRLWRFSEEALELDPVRFGIDHAVHAHWLGKQIDRWFSTETAKRIAREEQKKRVEFYGPPPQGDERPNE
jgi:HD superfamily phosphodiesterase